MSEKKILIKGVYYEIGDFKKNGYEKVTGILEDYPKGHIMYCMEKSL